MFRLLTGIILSLLMLSDSKTLNAQSGYAAVNGISMYYEIYGNGMPLVLIHGGGSTIQTTFSKLIPLLEKNHKVIAVELQAHGHTSDRDAPESFDQDADDVAALMKYLKIDKAAILGFSNGGNTAMKIGMKYPSMVSKLVVISAFYKREGMINGFFEGLEKAKLNDMPEHLRNAFLEIKNDSAALLTMFNKDVMRMMQFKDWNDNDLASIKAPTLLVLGDKDVMTTEHAVEMNRKISGSELLVLPGNHGSFIGEGMKENENSKMPALTVGIIEEFLNK
jgi:pimeloyl-ACP methyl ester carboxylesterase